MVGSQQRPIEDIAGAVRGCLTCHDFVSPGVVEQRIRRPPPIGRTETMPKEEPGLAAARRVGGVEQVVGPPHAD